MLENVLIILAISLIATILESILLFKGCGCSSSMLANITTVIVIAIINFAWSYIGFAKFSKLHFQDITKYFVILTLMWISTYFAFNSSFKEYRFKLFEAFVYLSIITVYNTIISVCLTKWFSSGLNEMPLLLNWGAIISGSIVTPLLDATILGFIFLGFKTHDR